MKIRLGFVSNSSSSSFIVKEDTDKIIDDFLKSNENLEELKKEFAEHHSKEEDANHWYSKTIKDLETIRDLIKTKESEKLIKYIKENIQFMEDWHKEDKITESGWVGDLEELEVFFPVYKDLTRALFKEFCKYFDEAKKDPKKIQTVISLYSKLTEYHYEKHKEIEKIIKSNLNNFFKQFVFTNVINFLHASPYKYLKKIKKIDFFDTFPYNYFPLDGFYYSRKDFTEEESQIMKDLSRIANKIINKFTYKYLEDIEKKDLKAKYFTITDGGDSGDICNPFLECGVGFKEGIIFKINNH